MDYLQVVKFICQMGPEMSAYLIEARVLHECLNIYLESQTPSNIIASMTSSQNEKYAQSNLLLIVDIFTLLIRACDTEGQRQLQTPSPVALFQNAFAMMLPESVQKVILDGANYIKSLIKFQQYNNNILYISQHLCWGDLYTSRILISSLVTSIS